MSEAKIILVGRGTAGKTSLAGRLVRGRFDPRVTKTAGINITEWTPGDAGLDRLNVWDFGGQELMHAAHQFFFTEDSLYLIVLSNLRGGEDADVEYWLKLVGCFAPASPVVVVLNKIKASPFEVNRSMLRQKYPALRGFVATDCKDGTGIEELRAAVLAEARQLAGRSGGNPPAWAEAARRVRAALPRGHMTFDRFRELCAEAGEAEPAAQEALAAHLHRRGVAVTYAGDRRLDDARLFNPRWVTAAVYGVLNSERLARQRGVLRRGELSRILDPGEYTAEAVGLVLDLMGKFDLCFPLGDGDDEYLFPELLGKEQPGEAAGFEPGECLSFEYHYPALPEGLLPRFIARTRRLSEEGARWRSGVILKDGDNSALVWCDLGERKVFVRVAGPAEGRRALLDAARAEFGRIHRDLSGLRPARMVPLPEYPERALAHDALVAFERAGHHTIQEVAGGEVIDVDVRALLDLVGRDTEAEADGR